MDTGESQQKIWRIIKLGSYHVASLKKIIKVHSNLVTPGIVLNEMRT
jgi:hypothetical protein